MKMRIVADSSANLLEMKDVEFASVPVHIIVGEQDYADTARSILRPTSSISGSIRKKRPQRHRVWASGRRLSAMWMSFSASR